jgi:hypothetical protein
MIRENSSRPSPKGSFISARLPLVALLTMTGLASVIACSSDDGDDDTDAVDLDGVSPVVVEARPALPAATPAPAPPPGSDTPNGLSLPTGMADWRVIGVVNIPSVDGSAATVRAILGNDAAVAAARSGQTNPWPDGAMLGHLQWQPGSEPASGTAVTPGAFARATVMVKDAEEYEADGGWAYGVWQGTDLVPPAAPAAGMPAFDRACVDCHVARVPDQDFVFTIPGELPSVEAITAAPVLANGMELPAGILDWRIIGVASREADANPTIRVIVGNDIAVEAARSGNTESWPDGSMLAHYSWVAGENPVAPDTVNPVSFAAFTLMLKNADDFAADGGWAYGVWSSLSLTAPEADDFDRACVNCHTDLVPDTDFVFTRPGALPAAFTD